MTPWIQSPTPLQKYIWSSSLRRSCGSVSCFNSVLDGTDPGPPFVSFHCSSSAVAASGTISSLLSEPRTSQHRFFVGSSRLCSYLLWEKAARTLAEEVTDIQCNRVSSGVIFTDKFLQQNISIWFYSRPLIYQYQVLCHLSSRR